MKPADPATTADIDLEACAREPIHIPGAIQPHGCLLAFDPGSRIVRQASANAGAATSAPTSHGILFFLTTQETPITPPKKPPYQVNPAPVKI